MLISFEILIENQKEAHQVAFFKHTCYINEENQCSLYLMSEVRWRETFDAVDATLIVMILRYQVFCAIKFYFFSPSEASHT